jgi:chorismate mutase
LTSKKNSPFIIAGPCSAETADQLINTAIELADTGAVNMLRAGIWKPRTRPNSFEGVGSVGLPWLMEASEITGLPAITEVANAKHVEETLKAGLKHLWIGARTSVNPFAVQEIADALKGTDIEIFVKNPINADLNLWIGAIERIKNAGLTNVHAIHRGFSSLKRDKYRNEPMWEIPLALKLEFPDIKLICDPSHIAGNRILLKEISQTAMDLIYDGLMIESHISPDDAWSDAAQQVTPHNFKSIIQDLIIRDVEKNTVSLNEDLKSLRSKINEIDQDILNLLGERMQIADKIGAYKKKHDITILQPKRWREIRDFHLGYCIEKGVSTDFILKYLDALHQESIRHQTNVMNS